MKLFILLGLASMAIMTAAAQSFTEQDVKVYNTQHNITLGGTLTMPDGDKPKAGLVLATGSGQQNRDEEIMGHKPFKAIAEYLSARGYAVLRIDDRGVGESGGNPATSTTDDYVVDISAAMDKLDSCLTVKVPIGVLGHSEGGTVAIKIANDNPECDFIVTLGAPAWSGDSIVMSQARAIATAMLGRWDGEATQRRILNLIKSETPTIMVRTSLYQILSEQLGEMAKMPEIQKQLSQQIEVLCSPWYREMIKYDPADDIRSVSVSWLALNGSKDIQVLPENLSTISSLNPEVTTRLMEGHNHLMQHCSTGLMQEYASIPEDISEDVLAEICKWLDTLR